LRCGSRIVAAELRRSADVSGLGLARPPGSRPRSCAGNWGRWPELQRLFPRPRALLAVAVLARAFIFAVPTYASTSGSARMLRYQPGCCGAPPFEATTK
jgi:hypothetical protein